MAFKNLRLGSDTSRLILLFVAILPATESKDWLFYTVSVLIIGLFIMHVIYAIQREFDIKSKDSKLPVIDKVYINGGFLLKKAVCCNS